MFEIFNKALDLLEKTEGVPSNTAKFIEAAWNHFSKDKSPKKEETLEKLKRMAKKHKVELPIAKSIPVRIIKSDLELGVIYGVASVGDYVDSQQDFIPTLELTKAFHDYMVSSRKGDIDHDFEETGTVVEGLILTPELIKAIKDGGIPENALFIGWKPEDPEIAKAASTGEYIGFSIAGTAISEDVSNYG